MENQRYCDKPFPPYAFVPGEAPHPTRDPDGHSYSELPEPPVSRVSPEDWRTSPDYLYGADLYNAGFLWEAHEAWEGLWHVVKPNPIQAQFIQGLIQCAAGCLKIRMGQKRGMQKLFEAGLKRVGEVMKQEGPNYMGLDIFEFCAAIREFEESDPPSPEGRPVIVLE
jgi:hypothetical protein